MLRLASLLTALMVAAAVASPTSQVSTLPVGVIDGYFDTQCTIFDAEIRPVVNIACAALPDNSIAVTDQACGHVEIYTDGACKSNGLRVELNACTDTSAYNSVKVVCP